MSSPGKMIDRPGQDAMTTPEHGPFEDRRGTGVVLLRDGPQPKGTGGEPSRRRGPDRRRRIRFALLACAPPLLMLLWGWRTSSEGTRLTLEVQRLEDRLEASREIVQRVDSLQQRRQGLADALTTLRRIEESRRGALGALEAMELSVRQTEGVWLVHVELDRAGWRLQGRAAGTRAIDEVLDRLRASPPFQRARLLHRESGRAGWEFEIVSAGDKP